MIRTAVRTPRSVSGQEKGQIGRSQGAGQERKIEEIGPRTGREKERERVPYPGYFAKWAEALDCKRVGGNRCFQVWCKCAEGI